jgi:benzoyl-CoA reductase/2-hydroxyglutaryl-CoA dehydratase subunit BcrC/BadD/HgdB
LDGLIHYTQSFCFRQIQDRLLRQQLNLPILTIEGDRPTLLDHRTRLRLEAFVDVLRH